VNGGEDLQLVQAPGNPKHHAAKRTINEGQHSCPRRLWNDSFQAGSCLPAMHNNRMDIHSVIASFVQESNVSF